MAYRFLGSEAEDHGNVKLAMAYYRYASRLPFSPDGERGTALCNLAYCESTHDDDAGALRDYEAILKLPRINKYLRAKTCFNVGYSRLYLHDYAGAIGPLTDSMKYRGTNEDNANSWLHSAYRWRAFAKEKTGDYKGSIDDYKECLAMPDMAENAKIKLKSEMASVLSKSGRHAEAIDVYTQLAESVFTTDEQRTDVLLKRGAEREKSGDYKGELADFDIALEVARFSPDPRCNVLTARGKVKRRHNDIDGALADYAAALAVEGISPEVRAKAYVARGFLKQMTLKDRASAAADYKAAFSLPGISKEAERVARANYEEVKP
jgi:tetratricopeptide (TPR) repeat protein